MIGQTIVRRIENAEATLLPAHRAPVVFFKGRDFRKPEVLFVDNAMTKTLEPEELKRMHERGAVVFLPGNGRG